MQIIPELRGAIPGLIFVGLFQSVAALLVTSEVVVGNTVNVFHIRKQSPHKSCGLKNLNMVQYLDYIGHLYMSEPAAPIELRPLTYLCNYRLKNAALPGYCAWLPSSSSMRRS